MSDDTPRAPLSVNDRLLSGTWHSGRRVRRRIVGGRRAGFRLCLWPSDAWKRELIETRCSRDDILAALRELQAASLARIRAQQELAGFYRERDIVRARPVQRDLSQPLQ